MSAPTAASFVFTSFAYSCAALLEPCDGSVRVAARTVVVEQPEADIELPDVEKLRQLLPEEGEEGGEQLSQLDIILQAISYIRSLQNNLHTTDRPEER